MSGWRPINTKRSQLGCRNFKNGNNLPSASCDEGFKVSYSVLRHSNVQTHLSIRLLDLNILATLLQVQNCVIVRDLARFDPLHQRRLNGSKVPLLHRRRRGSRFRGRSSRRSATRLRGRSGCRGRPTSLQLLLPSFQLLLGGLGIWIEYESLFAEPDCIDEVTTVVMTVGDSQTSNLEESLNDDDDDVFL